MLIISVRGGVQDREGLDEAVRDDEEEHGPADDPEDDVVDLRLRVLGVAVQNRADDEEDHPRDGHPDEEADHERDDPVVERRGQGVVELPQDLVLRGDQWRGRFQGESGGPGDRLGDRGVIRQGREEGHRVAGRPVLEEWAGPHDEIDAGALRRGKDDVAGLHRCRPLLAFRWVDGDLEQDAGGVLVVDQPGKPHFVVRRECLVVRVLDVVGLRQDLGADSGREDQDQRGQGREAHERSEPPH